jgi:acetyl-CoA acetyltransferase
MSETGSTPGTVYIVSGARTPMGGLHGALATLSAIEFGTLAIADAVRRTAPRDRQNPQG